MFSKTSPNYIYSVWIYFGVTFLFFSAVNERKAEAMGRLHGPFPPTYSQGLVT